MAVVLDSDAVIGFLDRDDALHQAADSTIRELAGEHRLQVSAVTYAEVLTGARLGHHDEGRVGGFFAELISAVVPVDIDVATMAAGFRSSTRSLRMPDALILATAQLDPDVEILVTGDATAARVPGLRPKIHLLH